MSDEAAHIAREAKGLQQGLKELLKTRDILDREIEIQRKNLRRQYLRLLLVHPNAKESKDAETHLWMQTSYTLISNYKQRIASLDRAIHNPSRQPQQQQPHPPQRVVEYRKLLQRFRQFLAEEEKFWTQLIVRLRRTFALDDAQPALTALGLTLDEDTPVAAEGPTPRRNQYQFPPDADVAAAASDVTTPSLRESRLAILGKALVCLGDIARYKEQYNEAGGRPRAGHEDGPPAASAGKHGRGRRGGAAQAAPVILPRLRNYDRAQQCYEQARFLLPHDGNPSHQLAILASYQKDFFNSLLHYYRALCVRHPYDTAAENLGTILHRALEQWKAKNAKKEKEPDENGASMVPRIRVESFTEKVLALHAYWRLGAEEADSLGQKVVEDFTSLVSDRILPIDMIFKTIILSQGALWKHRMIRRGSNGDKKGVRSVSTESHIATHLLALHRVLLEVGSVQLTEAPPEDAAEHDLAQRITAKFRRTLPALRMAGKWLRANTKYICQSADAEVGGTENRALAKEKGPAGDGRRGRDRSGNMPAVVLSGRTQFWREYAGFSDALLSAFPAGELPELSAPLEEDTDVAGFLPLRKYTMEARSSAAVRKANGTDRLRQSDTTQGQGQVHPNEEQLMRIADILADAKALAEDEFTPLALSDGHFVIKIIHENGLNESAGEVERLDNLRNQKDIPQAARAPAPQAIESHGEEWSDSEDEAMTSKTEDDPVGEVFRTVLSPSDDEDRIVWDPTPTSPVAQPPIPQHTSPISPKHAEFNLRKQEAPLLSPRGPEIQVDRAPQPKPIAPPLTTAQDLLKSVMGTSLTPRLGQPGSSHHARGSSAPPAHFLFPSQSIWSPSVGGDSLKHNGTTNSMANGSLYRSQPPPVPKASSHVSPVGEPWAPPYPTQTSQPAFNPPPPAPLLGQHAPQFSGGHQRSPSDFVSLSQPQLLPTRVPGQRYDPFGSGLAVGEQLGGPRLSNQLVNNQLPSYSDPIFSSSPGAIHHRLGYPDSFGANLQSNNLRPQRTYAPNPSSSSISNIWANNG